MALILADRVRDTTTTTGTGTVTLSGTAPTGYQNFSAIGNGNTTYYTINGGSEWEVGIGTYSSTGPTLARTTVLASSNSGSLVNFSAGTKDVFVTYPAEKSVNYDASNNVGIGIAPSTKLDVAGPIWSRSGGSVGAVAALFADASSGANGITLSASFVTGGYGPIKLDAGGSERMRIDSSGLVGVGTSSPSTYNGLLNVKASDRAVIGYFGGTTYATRLGANSSYATVEAVDAATGVSSYQPLQIGGSLLKFDTGGSERMQIDSSGNVGIGTGSPSYLLHVVGGTSAQYRASGDNMAFYGSTSDTSNSYLRLQNTSGYADFTLGNASVTINNAVNGPTIFNTNSTERMRLTSTGVLGLGIAGGDASFHIVGIRGGNGRMTQMSTGGTSQDNLNLIASSDSGGSDQWFSYGVTASNYFFIQNGVGAGSSGFVVASNNRVGIGIATPSGPLDVRASAGTTAIINSYNDSSSGNVASVFSNLQSNANSTSSYHYAGVTQGVNIWYLYGNGTSSWSSDQRLKKNIESTRDGYLDDLCRLRVVKYNWHTDAEDKPRELGLIAQEVEEVFPGLVEDALHTIDETETKYKVLKGSVLPYMLLKALQEANAKIDALTARVAQLEGN